MTNKTEEARKFQLGDRVTKTEEQLRREVVVAARYYPTERGADYVMLRSDVRAAFDALRDHYQARPTSQTTKEFEGDEEKVRRWLVSMRPGWSSQALALLDAKDEQIATLCKAANASRREYRAMLAAKDAEIDRLKNALEFGGEAASVFRCQRDEALARAERAEAEVLEQARVNGMGGEREAALMAKLEQAEQALATGETRP